MAKITCTITFIYDEDEFVRDWEKSFIKDEEVFKRCKLRMLDDICDFTDPIDISAVKCTKVED